MAKNLFPLATLEGRLKKISKDLHEGRGITIIRGLTPSKYSPLDSVLLLAGLTSYLGERRGAQDRFGNMLSKANGETRRALLTSTKPISPT